MDEQKESDITGKQRDSTKKEGEEKFHLLMVHERTRINQELDQLKATEHQINQKLRWFSYLDMKIEWKMQEIKNYEDYLGKVDCSFPNSVQRKTGFLHLSGKDAQTQPVRPDRKRCTKRLINKGRMDIEYLEEVQEEHLSLMTNSSKITYSGTQELDDMIQSMVQRIQHGNKKRSDEIKMYQELSKFKETKESYIAPEPQLPYYWYPKTQRAKEKERSNRFRKIILLEDLEKLKQEQVEGGKSRVRQLKAELDHVRKNIDLLLKKEARGC